MAEKFSFDSKFKRQTTLRLAETINTDGKLAPITPIGDERRRAQLYVAMSLVM